MGKEIERKFLVSGAESEWRKVGAGIIFRQGYLSTDKERIVRLRSMGDQAFLTVKGITQGIERVEYEYEIPFPDAQEMLEQLCIRPIIEKVRYTVVFQGCTWVIDEFRGENSGLIMAEIELEEVSQTFPRPPWLGAEITHDPRYFNSNLVNHPFSRWTR